jgi:hypothetical protein
LFIANWLALLIDSVVINRVSCVDGLLLKRRVKLGSLLILGGNVFLRLTHSRILMFVSTTEWQRWEYTSYQTLYGGGCEIRGRDALLIQPFAGTNLKTHLEAGTLTHTMLEAAALELQRAHRLGFTHGDPHLENVLVDTTRARLIDFETRHESRLSLTERQADDLLVLLLDLLGRDPTMGWLDLSRTFLSVYEGPAVLAELSRRLQLPRGWELILWKTRTNHLSQPALSERIETLRLFTERLTYRQSSIQ